MLPSKKRLSRADFSKFLVSPGAKTVFNQLGTLKYKEAGISQASVVVSSKIEKRAVYRNRLRRRLYIIFSLFLKDLSKPRQYVLYASKQAKTLEYKELKSLLYDLLQKTAK